MENKKEEKATNSKGSMIAVFRDLAVILAVISSLIGFGPQIIDSITKLVDTKRQYDLFSAYIDYGKDLFKNEFYREATNAFEEALKLQPHDIHSQVWLKKAKLLEALYKLNDIQPEDIAQLSFEVEFVIRSSLYDPEVYRYYYVQGNIRNVLKNLEGARDSYEKALKLKADYGPALANLGAVLNDLKQHEKAIKVLRDAILSDYVEETVYNNLVFALHSAGKNQEAVSTANEGLRHFPTSAGIYNELGIALYRMGRMEESISALKTAYVMTPEQDTDHFVQRSINLAYPLADLGRIDEALSAIEAAKDLKPEDPHIYLSLAYCHNKSGNDLEALKAYEKISSLGAYPDSDELVKWAQILLRVGRSGEAIRILHIAVDTWKNNKKIIEKITALAAKLDDQELIKKIDGLTSK
jgi:tetratricopeptide (TPR) repeat protein